MKAREPIEALLQEFRPAGRAAQPVTVQKALFLARRLQERAAELQTPAEKRQPAELCEELLRFNASAARRGR